VCGIEKFVSNWFFVSKLESVATVIAINRKRSQSIVFHRKSSHSIAKYRNSSGEKRMLDELSLATSF